MKSREDGLGPQYYQRPTNKFNAEASAEDVPGWADADDKFNALIWISILSAFLLLLVCLISVKVIEVKNSFDFNEDEK